MRRRKSHFGLALMLSLAAITLLSGCADNVQKLPPNPTPPVIVDPPGIYDAPGGQVRAVGILDRVALEGGFWALVGVADTESAESLVVVVISNAEDMGVDLAGYRGRYVEVVGTLVGGASIRMAGPEVEARSITVIVEGDPADPVQ